MAWLFGDREDDPRVTPQWRRSCCKGTGNQKARGFGRSQIVTPGEYYLTLRDPNALYYFDGGLIVRVRAASPWFH